jgi:PAS domain-containing protein
LISPTTAFREHWKQRAGTGYRGKLRLVRGEGTVFLADVDMSRRRVAGGGMLRVALRRASRGKRAESAMHYGEEGRYCALLNSVSDFIAAQGTDGTFSYVSPSVERLLGYRPEEMVDTLEASYVHPDPTTTSPTSTPWDLKPSAGERFSRRKTVQGQPWGGALGEPLTYTAPFVTVGPASGTRGAQRVSPRSLCADRRDRYPHLPRSEPFGQDLRSASRQGL